LIDEWHSGVLDVRSFSAANCDAVHYQVVAKVKGRLAVIKQAAQKFHVERFNWRLGNSIRLRSQTGLYFGIIK
jgi:hypothetical protein